MAKKYLELPLPEPQAIDTTYTYTIGIDPDTEASGIAIWCNERSEYIAYTRVKFFELYHYLDDITRYGTQFEVAIEAGWNNPSIMHNIFGYCTIAKAASIGANVGANHECGRKIVEMCSFLGIKHYELTPTSSKWTPTMLKHLTGIELGKSQQDIIDAMRLVFHFKRPIEHII